MDYGVYGKVLFCGQLEKRRDGAVRGGWATRLFILTPDSLHYYRKQTEQELLGEERGSLPLTAIKSVRAMPEDDAPPNAVEPNAEHYYLEINTETRSFLMRTSISEASTCESWSIAIEEQRKALRNEVDEIAEPGNPPEALPSPTLLAKNHEMYSLFEESPPSLAMISIANINERDGKQNEHVVKRKVNWGEVLELGVVPQGAACIILLQDGGIGRIGTQALMSTWDAGQTAWIEVTDAEFPTEIEVSVTCKVIQPSEISPKNDSSSSSSSSSSTSPIPKWMEKLDEGSSISFLLMCLFVHLLYGVDGFHWSHKCCLTVGAALAIMTILNGSSSRTTSATPSISKMPSNLLPKLEFCLTVHRCRIKMEGTEYLYPENAMKK